MVEYSSVSSMASYHARGVFCVTTLHSMVESFSLRMKGRQCSNNVFWQTIQLWGPLWFILSTLKVTSSLMEERSLRTRCGLRKRPSTCCSSRTKPVLISYWRGISHCLSSRVWRITWWWSKLLPLRLPSPLQQAQAVVALETLVLTSKSRPSSQQSWCLEC